MSLVLSGSGVVTGLDSLASSDLGAQLGSKLNIAGGKILQIVRATDSTSRTTSSTTYVDVTGMSVTISPTKSDSAIIVICVASLSTGSATDANNYVFVELTDSSNNALSGAQGVVFGVNSFTGSSTRNTFDGCTVIGYATPATTSAVTYKARFKTDLATLTATFRNNLVTGQMYAIEVSA